MVKETGNVAVEIWRPATVFIATTLVLVFIVVSIALAAPEILASLNEQTAYEYGLGQEGSGKIVVERLDITDACISTGERYVRAPGTTEISSSLQIYPGALSMYLSEAVVAPPSLETYSKSLKNDRWKEMKSLEVTE